MRLAARHELPDADFVDGVLKAMPLTSAVPEEAEALIRQAYALLPHVKITDPLLEVDRWTRFTDDFTHLKKVEPAKDRALLLTVILADAINLGLNKMAEACPGTSIAKLSWLSAWHIGEAHLSPLGWEHINLTGDYVWHSNKRVAKGRFRPLRSPKDSMTRLFTLQPGAIAVGTSIADAPRTDPGGRDSRTLCAGADKVRNVVLPLMWCWARKPLA